MKMLLASAAGTVEALATDKALMEVDGLSAKEQAQLVDLLGRVKANLDLPE